MARYIPIGTPTNRTETEGLRYLRDRLPDDCLVIGNFELQLPRRRNTLEFDALVLTRWGIYAVEIKGWTGKIQGDIRRWRLRWGKVESPFIRIETKAKALRDLLARNVEGWPDDLYCESVVYLPGKKVDITLDDPRERKLILHHQELDFFTRRASTEHPDAPPLFELDQTLRDRIEALLLPLATPMSTIPEVQDYLVDEELETGKLPYREFSGRHTLLKSRGKVRIKSYSIDPLVPADRREDEFARALQDIEVLNTIADNPYVARAYELIRDMDDALRFHAISEWVGSKTLRDVFDAQQRGKYLDEATTWSYAAHLVHAVALIHRRNITHRNLHPSVVRMNQEDHASIPFKLSDFDFSRMGRVDVSLAALPRFVKEGYGAPETWLGDVLDQRVDVYSVGALLFELFARRPLYGQDVALLRHQEIWELRQHLIEDDECRAVLAEMLAYKPERRPDDLEGALLFFAERARELGKY